MCCSVTFGWGSQGSAFGYTWTWAAGQMWRSRAASFWETASNAWKRGNHLCSSLSEARRKWRKTSPAGKPAAAARRAMSTDSMLCKSSRTTFECGATCSQ